MADVNKLAPFILDWEGGWVDDDNDLGGATNKGVTMQTYELYCRKNGYPRPTEEQLKNLTDEQFTEILKTLYWDKCKGDYIQSQSVANVIVDWAWNSGTGTAIKQVQNILGVKVDGIIGNITLSAINSSSPLPLFGQIKKARIAYIESICKARKANNKYKKGWLRRVEDLHFFD